MNGLKPTKEQEAAIDHEGSLVAIAKPGSGKTFMLSYKIAAILDELPNHRGVIAISYTNKASEELKRRVLSRGVESKASFFGTIDRFCDGEIIIPFLSHLWGKPKAEIVITRIRDLSEDEQSDFEGIQENQVSLDDIETHADMLKSRFLNGQLFLETTGALALYTTTHSKACRHYLSARYSHIIIDEFQDSGLEQYELLLKTQSLRLVAIAVGDADQSIYGFSNKDSKYLLNLAKNPSFKSFPITFNHRCHPSIINYSLRLIDPNAKLLDTDEIRVFEKCCTGTPSAVARWIESVLPTVMAKFSVKKASHVGILVRGGTTGLLVNDSFTIKHRYFAPHPLEEDSSLWSRLFCQLLNYRFDQNHSAQEIIEGVSFRKSDDELRKARKLIKAVRTCSEDDLYETMEEAASCLMPDARKETPLELLRESSVDELPRYFAPASDDEVQIMSFHKSKGLEFDIVFHLDLYEWLLPSKRPGPRNDFDNPVYPAWDQDVNLHYVGVTRARKACFLCWSTRRVNSQGNERTGSRSEFLEFPALSELRMVSEY